MKIAEIDGKTKKSVDLNLRLEMCIKTKDDTVYEFNKPYDADKSLEEHWPVWFRWFYAESFSSPEDEVMTIAFEVRK